MRPVIVIYYLHYDPFSMTGCAPSDGRTDIDSRTLKGFGAITCQFGACLRRDSNRAPCKFDLHLVLLNPAYSAVRPAERDMLLEYSRLSNCVALVDTPYGRLTTTGYRHVRKFCGDAALCFL
jgi:hypothetical protein